MRRRVGAIEESLTASQTHHCELENELAVAKAKRSAAMVGELGSKRSGSDKLRATRAATIRK